MSVLHSTPGYESVLITSGPKVVLQADGFGAQTEPMIEAARRLFRSRLREYLQAPRLASAPTRDVAQLVARHPDWVVTRDGRVVAVLFPIQAGGGDLMVVRLNPERPTVPTASASTTGREPALSNVTAPSEPAEGGEA